MLLIDIERRSVRRDPTITIYNGRCVLSSAACKLLDLPRDSTARVRIRQDMDEARLGRTRIFIAKSHIPIGYPISWSEDRMTGQINSESLSSRLSEKLSGFGTYRICEEVFTEDEGVRQYEIFFKKYRG